MRIGRHFRKLNISPVFWIQTVIKSSSNICTCLNTMVPLPLNMDFRYLPIQESGEAIFKGRQDKEIRTVFLLPFVKNNVWKINLQRRDSVCLFMLKAEIVCIFICGKWSYSKSGQWTWKRILSYYLQLCLVHHTWLMLLKHRGSLKKSFNMLEGSASLFRLHT